MAGDLVLTDVHDVLLTTRSVRRRLDFERPVDADVIGTCLQIALQAPTGGHAEDWRWIAVGEQAVKERLGRIYLRNFEEHVLAPLRGAAGAQDQRVAGRLGGTAEGGLDARTAKILKGAEHLAHSIARAPWLVLACATRPDPLSGRAGTNSALYGSVYPALWSFSLALRARGLGSVFTSLTLHSVDEVADLLGIPEGVVQVCLVPVAYTVGTDFRVAARKPVREVAFLDRWGAPFPYEDRSPDDLRGAL